MFFVAVTTKALRSRADGFAVHACVHIPPVNVKSILTSTSYLVFVFFEFLIAHHNASISVTDDIVIFNIGINVLASHLIHMHSLHFNNNYKLIVINL